MKLEDIKRGLAFTNNSWEKMTQEQRKELAYIVIEVYQNSCTELLKIIEGKEENNDN